MSSTFELSGTTVNDGKMHGCIITITTPDGNITKLESGLIYDNEQHAAWALKLDDIIKEFTENHGVEVIDKHEGLVH